MPKGIKNPKCFFFAIYATDLMIAMMSNLRLNRDKPQLFKTTQTDHHAYPMALVEEIYIRSALIRAFLFHMDS